MENLWLVILCSLAGGLFSLTGGFVLLLTKRKGFNPGEAGFAFAGGALLATAFLDLIPEALQEADGNHTLTFVLLGILAFYCFERSLHWFHHHHHPEHPHSAPFTTMIIVGDTLHNAFDGIAIAAGFLTSVPTGIALTLAVAAHEIPQEIGDFALMLHAGFSEKRVVMINVLSSLSTTIAAVAVYLGGGHIQLPMAALLGLVAGFFIYIALSDIIPRLDQKQEDNPKLTVALLFGVGLIALVTYFLQ
ncbi:MAG: ZIP family metal transporter [Erysipelotrichaceae bacterium]|jgi:zinc and cadmium transporter|nr:ZIP family metal transporter [Erysipelotrichaceae bacterium]